jgi:RNA polymerase sigma-70 factor (ECF subfamily)
LAAAPLGRPALVNGAAGALVEIDGVVRAVAGFTVVDGRIVEIDLLLDPEKLRRVAAGG